MGVNMPVVLAMTTLTRANILKAKESYRKLSATIPSHKIGHHLDPTIMPWLSFSIPDWAEKTPEEFFETLLVEHFPEQNLSKRKTVEDLVKEIDSTLFHVNYADVTCWTLLFPAINSVITKMGGADKIDHEEMAKALTKALNRDSVQRRFLAGYIHPEGKKFENVLRDWYHAGIVKIRDVNRILNEAADCHAIPRPGAPWDPKFDMRPPATPRPQGGQRQGVQRLHPGSKAGSGERFGVEGQRGGPGKRGGDSGRGGMLRMRPHWPQIRQMHLPAPRTTPPQRKH